MKRYFPCLLLLLTLISFPSCRKNVASSELASIVKSMNEGCPQKFEFGSVTSVDYDKDDNIVTFNYDINCKNLGIDFDLLRDNIDQVRDIMIIVGDNADMKMLVEKMVDSDASLNLVFHDISSSDKFECKLSPADLKKILNSDFTEKEKNDKILDIQVLIAKSACPVTLDEVTTLVDVVREGNTIKYVNELDDSQIDMSFIKENSSEFKRSIGSEISSNPVASTLLQALVAVGGDIEYVYKGKQSGEICVIEFSPEDITKLIHKGAYMRHRGK